MSLFPSRAAISNDLGAGVTHDAVLMSQETGGMTLRKASAPTDAPSVAQAIGAIMAEVSEGAWR